MGSPTRADKEEVAAAAPPAPARRTPGSAAASGEPFKAGVGAGPAALGAGLSCGAAVLHDSVVFGEGPVGLS